jgi:hypothetical protein
LTFDFLFLVGARGSAGAEVLQDQGQGQPLPTRVGLVNYLRVLR